MKTLETRGDIGTAKGRIKAAERLWKFSNKRHYTIPVVEGSTS